MVLSPDVRNRLRAYEETDACRLSAMLAELIAKGNPIVPRQAVIDLWTERCPFHAAPEGKRSIRTRIRYGLSSLKKAGIVEAEPDADEITVIDRENLRLSASNLAIVDDAGRSVGPQYWTRQPAVPDELREAQRLLREEQALRRTPPT